MKFIRWKIIGTALFLFVLGIYFATANSGGTSKEIGIFSLKLSLILITVFQTTDDKV